MYANLIYKQNVCNLCIINISIRAAFAKHIVLIPVNYDKSVMVVTSITLLGLGWM